VWCNRERPRVKKKKHSLCGIIFEVAPNEKTREKKMQLPSSPSKKRNADNITQEQSLTEYLQSMAEEHGGYVSPPPEESDDCVDQGGNGNGIDDGNGMSIEMVYEVSLTPSFQSIEGFPSPPQRSEEVRANGPYVYSRHAE
jgi:hypothetical protein